MVKRAPREFKKILLIESFLHLVNPSLLLAVAILLMISALVAYSPTALAILILGLALLSIKQYRTWIVQQFFLAVGVLRNLWTREIVWRKESKE